jgi:ADP-ribose pyrophosphatase YjhB (NUDIX family)
MGIKPPNYQYCPFCGKKLNSIIEEGKNRKLCKSCRWTYYPHVASAVAAVVVQNGKTLMVRRKRKPYKNTWTFPAGFIDFGEHPLEALRREVKEETGLNVKKASFFHIMQAIDDLREPGHFVFFYKVETKAGKVETDKEENEEIEWIDINNPPRIGWKTHKYILKLLQKQNS